MSPIVLIGAGLLIALAGTGLGYWLGSFGRKHESEKASELQAELDKYRRDVTEHFSETAAHFQTLGKEYRKLYEHMAVGAGALCDTDQSGPNLSFAPVELLASAADAHETILDPVIADAPRDFAAAEESAPESGADTSAAVPDQPEGPVDAEGLARETTAAATEVSETAEELLAEKTEEPGGEKIYH